MILPRAKGCRPGGIRGVKTRVKVPPKSRQSPAKAAPRALILQKGQPKSRPTFASFLDPNISPKRFQNPTPNVNKKNLICASSFSCLFPHRFWVHFCSLAHALDPRFNANLQRVRGDAGVFAEPCKLQNMHPEVNNKYSQKAPKSHHKSIEK